MTTYYTVNQICQIHPAYTPAAIRHLIFNEQINGFSDCVLRVGKKVIIDSEKFEKWIESHSVIGEKK